MKNQIKNCILLISGIIMSFSALSQLDPDGYNTFYYPNGNRSSEGNMKNGKPDGYWKTYYENGLLKSEGNRNKHLRNLLQNSERIWKLNQVTNFRV